MKASKVLAALCCLALSSVCVAQAAPPPAAPQAGQPAKPKKAAPPCKVSPALAQLGKLKPMSVTPAAFVLTNTGTEPLTVKSALPSCKCTGIAPIVGKVIPPGGSLEMVASLKAPPTPGEKEASVYITFEGDKYGPVEAKLKGDVEMPVHAEPDHLEARKDARSGAIKVLAPDGKPFRVVRAGGEAPVFVGFDPAKDAPRAEYLLRWNYQGRDDKMPIWWVIETDRADSALIPLRIWNENLGGKWDMARFERQWFVKDAIVMAGIVKQGESVEVVVELEFYNPKKAPVKPTWSQITSVASGTPDIAATLLEVKVLSETAAEVKVRLTPRSGFTGGVYSTLNVTGATGGADIPLTVMVVP